MPLNPKRSFNATRKTAHMEPRERHNFFHAAKNGYISDIKSYLAAYPKAVEERQFSRTALQEAVARGQYAAMMTLLDAGADPNALSDNGKNGVLFEAARIDRADLLGMLLHKGGHGWQQLADGTTLMMHAARHDSARVITALIARGQAGAAFDAQRNAALHVAAASGSGKAVHALINGDADINIKNAKGETPLMTAVRFQMKDAVKALLELNADVRLRNPAGQTAQDIATQFKGDTQTRFYDDFMALLRAREASDTARFHAPFHDGTAAPVTVKKPYTLKKGR